MPAIVVRLYGGLGNQLFCYAMAKQFALTRGLPLKLDTRSGFLHDPYSRQYMLPYFCIGGYEEATARESFLDPLGPFRRVALRKVSQLLPLKCRRYVHQNDLFARGGRRHDFFGGAVQDVGQTLLDYRPHGSVYLDGYWQDARLFQGVERVLREELVPRFPLSAAVEKLSDQIQSVQSVCVHVRAFHELTKRQLNEANNGRGLPGAGYYKKAIDCVRARVSAPVFYCFTEQVAYARSVLPSDVDVRMVQLPPDADRRRIDVAEFHLMSKCHHFISAQSTYVWWAAYVSAHASKMITVPDDVAWCDNKGYRPSGLITIQGAYDRD